MAALWEPSPPNAVEDDWSTHSVHERIHTLVLALIAATVGGGGISCALLFMNVLMN